MIKKNNKRGISELLSYVLLITLALAMAGGVYAWLKFYASNPLPEEQCEGVSLAITSVTCTNNELTITLKNTGRFNVFARVKLYNGDKYITEGDIKKISEGIMKTIDIGDEDGETGTIEYNEDIIKIEVIPFKHNEEKGYDQFCSNAQITETVTGCEYNLGQQT